MGPLIPKSDGNMNLLCGLEHDSGQRAKERGLPTTSESSWVASP